MSGHVRPRSLGQILLLTLGVPALIGLGTCASCVMCMGARPSKIAQQQQAEDTLPSKLGFEEKTESEKHYEIVAEFGVIKTVYMSPAGLQDRNYVAGVLNEIVNKHSHRLPIQVMFFDSKRDTPLRFPMSDSQVLRQRAQYNKNPHTGFEEFVWITVKNSGDLDMNHEKAGIRPGRAE